MKSETIVTKIDGPYQEARGWRVVWLEVRGDGKEKRCSKILKTQLLAVEYINSMRGEDAPREATSPVEVGDYKTNDWWLKVCATLTAKIIKALDEGDYKRLMLITGAARTISSLAGTSRGYVGNAGLEKKLMAIEKQQKAIEKAKQSGARLGLKTVSDNAEKS